MDLVISEWLSEPNVEVATHDFEEIKMNNQDYFKFESFSSSESYPLYQNKVFDHDMESVAEEIKFLTDKKKLKNKIDHKVDTKASLASSSSPPTQFICFGDQNGFSMKPKEGLTPGVMENLSYLPELDRKYSTNFPHLNSTVSSSRAPSQAQDNVLAERRRREKLNQRFIALSALIPGLHKMDKATVLEDATNYLKQLQEQVKALEEQTATRVVESVTFVKKSRIYFDSDNENSSSSEEGYECKTNQSCLPEVEAKVSDNNVLIRVHCEKQKGFVAKVFSEIEKLHLNVTNSNVLPFGDHTLDITIVAQMKSEYNIKLKDVVKALKNALDLIYVN